MDASQNYVDQYLRRKKGAAFGPTVIQAQVTSAANQVHHAARAAQQRQHQQCEAPAAPCGPYTAAAPVPAPVQAPTACERASNYPPPPQQQQQQQPIHGAAVAAAPGTVAAGFAMPPAAAPLDTEALSNIAELSSQVQNFVDRTDTLNLQVQTLEDKLLNLTKMLKLSQNLAEEREHDLRLEIKDLRGKNRQQQHHLDSLNQHFDAFRDVTVPAMVLAAVEDVTGKAALAMDERDERWDERLEATRTQVIGDMQDRMDALVSEEVAEEARKRMAGDAEVRDELEQETAAAIRGAERRATEEAAGQLARRAELLSLGIEAAGSGARAHADNAAERVALAAAATAEQKVRDAVAALERSVEKDMHILAERMARGDEQSERRVADSSAATAGVEASCKELAAGLREHAAEQREKAEEATKSMQDLMALHEQTRNVVSQELEGTKQWATRNMQRIKKHMDNTNGDIVAVREAQAMSQSQVQQMQATQSSETRRLQTVLADKTKEAAALSDMVDKEISSMHRLTAQHKKQMDEDSRAREEEAIDSYQDRAEARREKLGAVFSDLKNRGRPHSQPPAGRR